MYWYLLYQCMSSCKRRWKNCGLTSVLGKIGNSFRSRKHWSTLENVKFVVFPSFTLSPDVIKFRFCHMSPKVQLGNLEFARWCNTYICSSESPANVHTNSRCNAHHWKNTVLLYSRTSNCLTTNECRRELFCQGRSIDDIPPISAALWKHTLRSRYVAGHVWVQSMFKDRIPPNPENWGWKMENSNLIPHWTDLPEATIAIRDLIKCSCKPEKGCRGRYKCVQSQFSCTELCCCKGDCERIKAISLPRITFFSVIIWSISK